MRAPPFLLLPLLALGLLGPAAASGQTTSPFRFRVTLSGDANSPRIDILNESPALSITKFEITIGKINYNFDIGDTGALEGPPGGTTTLLVSDRSDSVSFSATSWGPGETVTVYTDVDAD